MALVDYVDLSEIEGDKASSDHEGSERPSLFMRALANNPRMLDAHRDFHFRVMYEGEVDRRLKELAHVSVSYTNECDYCASSHTQRLMDSLDLPETEVAAISRGNFSGVDSLTRAVIELATQVADDPKRVEAAHLDALRDEGFNESAIIELLEICAEAMAANTIVQALNVHPADYEDVEGEFDLIQYHPDSIR